jgi:large subunit ribosomal protein L19
MKLQSLEDKHRRGTPLPDFAAGDTVRVHYRVKEGEKERIQVFQGVVIRRHGGRGLGATFTVRKISYGIGVERTFPVNSPLIDELEVARHGRVRRARLYFLRQRTGKKARISEKTRAFLTRTEAVGAEVPATEAEETPPSVPSSED